MLKKIFSVLDRMFFEIVPAVPCDPGIWNWIREGN